jgi:hypothetical protein
VRRLRLAWALLRGAQLQAHRLLQVRLLQVRQRLGLQRGLLRQVRMQKRQAKMQTF